MALTREQIAQRIARELEDGMFVNLGIGIPTLVANYLPKGVNVVLQSENGLLGMQVDVKGSLANWMIPGKMVKGMGGAMDLVAGSKRIIIAMQHVSKDGESKILPECTLPLTGTHCVSLVVTELGVLRLEEGKAFRLLERAPGVSVEEIKKATAAPLIADANVPEMTF
jgi:3-oxoacid CoA-transferase subunit B